MPIFKCNSILQHRKIELQGAYVALCMWCVLLSFLCACCSAFICAKCFEEVEEYRDSVFLHVSVCVGCAVSQV